MLRYSEYDTVKQIGGIGVILEVATLVVKSGEEAGFEATFREASRYIREATGYQSHELQRCLEVMSKYVLLVRWQTVEDHTITFKGSADYQKFRALIHPYYVNPPQAEHFEQVEGA